MTKISLSLVPSPLTTPLLDGTVKIEGVAVVPHAAKSVDDNSRAMLGGGFDVAEMSLATFSRAKDGGAALTGLPIFPGRRFTQPGIAVRKGSGIASPRDLAGRRVALPQYWLTSSVWHRGVLLHEYGVAPETVEWVTVVAERGEAEFPKGVRVTPREGAKIPELLASGEVDAALVPRPVTERGYDPAAGPGFADVAAEQRGYLSRTGIFPIMHFIVARTALLDEAPELPRVLRAAFEAAKRSALADQKARQGLELPVHGLDIDAALAVFGGDAWPYGLARNRTVLDTFFGYAQEQGLVRQKPSVDALFVKDSSHGGNPRRWLEPLSRAAGAGGALARHAEAQRGHRPGET